MDHQSLIAAAIVVITVVLFLVRLTRKPGKSGSCGHDCGCHRSKDDNAGG